MKAILVIDMPKNCAECKLIFLQGIGESLCNAVDWEVRPSWCPLKPMPHSKQMENRWFSDEYSKGWNDCLEEIENESTEKVYNDDLYEDWMFFDKGETEYDHKNNKQYGANHKNEVGQERMNESNTGS